MRRQRTMSGTKARSATRTGSNKSITAPSELCAAICRGMKGHIEIDKLGHSVSGAVEVGSEMEDELVQWRNNRCCDA